MLTNSFDKHRLVPFFGLVENCPSVTLPEDEDIFNLDSLRMSFDLEGETASGLGLETSEEVLEVADRSFFGLSSLD